jgi:hypothetical protein
MCLHRTGVCVALFCLLAAPVVRAEFTVINPPHHGEHSHEQILSTLYGGLFSSSGDRGVDFSNGSIIAHRVSDRIDNILFGGDGGGEPLNMGGPTGGVDDTDQTWRAAFTNAVAEAKFAAYEQNFGFFDGVSGGTYQQLFRVQGEQYGVTGEAVLPILPTQTIRWGRGGEGRILSSRNADNADGEDHMVTYQILPASMGEGEEPVLRWLVFWEDILRGEQHEDFDFNDLVVEITAIPEPASGGLVGLLALLGLRRRRR